MFLSFCTIKVLTLILVTLCVNLPDWPPSEAFRKEDQLISEELVRRSWKFKIWISVSGSIALGS